MTSTEWRGLCLRGFEEKSKEELMSKKVEERLAPCKSLVEGEVVPGLIVGTTGKTYRGREVVSCVFPPGLFGTRKEGRVRKAELTLSNGILNQCSIGKEGEPPTPYWAVLDAAIALKSGFRRKDVMDLAVKSVGESKRRSCEIAWDVIRNHHRHERKRDAGMAYMIDSVDGGKLVVRARDAGETLQYFQAQSERKLEAQAALEPKVEPAKEEPAPVGVGA